MYHRGKVLCQPFYRSIRTSSITSSDSLHKRVPFLLSSSSTSSSVHPTFHLRTSTSVFHSQSSTTDNHQSLGIKSNGITTIKKGDNKQLMDTKTQEGPLHTSLDDVPSLEKLLREPYGFQGGEQFRVSAKTLGNRLSCSHLRLPSSHHHHRHRHCHHLIEGEVSIVLLHASGFHKELWYPALEELGEAIKEQKNSSPFHSHTKDIFAIDLPGHGDSEQRRSDDYSWKQLGKDVHSVIETLGLTNQSPDPISPSLPSPSSSVVCPPKYRIGVGHSIGGAVLASIEASHPGTFTHLFLIEPILVPPEIDMLPSTSLKLASSAEKRRSWFADINSTRKAYHERSIFTGWEERALEAYVHHGFEDSVLLDPRSPLEGGKKIRKLKCLPSSEAATFSGSANLWERFNHSTPIPASSSGPFSLENIKAERNRDWLTGLSRLRLPVTMVAGEYSQHFGNDPFFFKKLFEFLPNIDRPRSAFHLLPDSGHMLVQQQPREFIRSLLLPFLESSVTTSPSTLTLEGKL